MSDCICFEDPEAEQLRAEAEARRLNPNAPRMRPQQIANNRLADAGHGSHERKELTVNSGMKQCNGTGCTKMIYAGSKSGLCKECRGLGGG